MIAAIYQALGVLSKGHLVETDRSSLIGEYVGHTAGRVKAKVKESLGGILFIDEAYTLTSRHEADYGAEAIATLLLLMENHRDEFAVIVAGYPKEMNEFLEANPGLRSRFNNYLRFEDYTPRELATILSRMCTNEDYELASEAEDSAHDLFQAICAKRDASFGNGRVARNCFEQAVRKQSDRLASQASLEASALRLLIREDIPTSEELMPSEVSTSS